MSDTDMDCSLGDAEKSGCEFPSERNDGTLCGFEVESIVDVVRDEGDGESTFFTLPMCLGHRLALGEFVITHEAVSHE